MSDASSPQVRYHETGEEIREGREPSGSDGETRNHRGEEEPLLEENALERVREMARSKS